MPFHTVQEPFIKDLDVQVGAYVVVMDLSVEILLICIIEISFTISLMLLSGYAALRKRKRHPNMLFKKKMDNVEISTAC